MHIVRTFLIATLVAVCAPLAHAQGDPAFTVEIVDADPQAGFNFPYVLRLPKAGVVQGRRFLVVESNNTGADDNFQNQLAAVESSIGGSGIGPTVAAALEVPLLIPVFPRSRSDWQVYTHALDRDTMLLANDPRQRLDLQLLSMVRDAQHRLKDRGIRLHARFALVGFSASGTFSNRFAFLHPGSLLAVVSGAVNAFPMLPVASVNGSRFEFPLGVADIKELTGEEFRADDWKALPQMIFMGAVDDNDAVKFDDAYSPEERQLIFNCVGQDMGARWSASQRIYLDLQPNVTFHTYGQVGHWTDGRINRDIVNFVDSAMRRADAMAGK